MYYLFAICESLKRQFVFFLSFHKRILCAQSTPFTPIVFERLETWTHQGPKMNDELRRAETKQRNAYTDRSPQKWLGNPN